MWLLIILGIIVWIFVSFFSKRSKLQKEVIKEGGMAQKYSVLLAFFTNGGAHITRLTSDNVQLIQESKYHVSSIQVVQTFEGVHILWKAKGLMGEFKKTWDFSSNMDQNEMAEKISEDVEHEVNNRMSLE